MSGVLQMIFQNQRSFQSYWLGYLSPGYGYGVAVDSSSNMYLCGISSDIQVAKYNASGIIQWQRSLNEGSFDWGRGVAADSSGNMYICGDTQNNKIQVAKYDTSGTLQWKRALNNSIVPARGNGIAVDSSGNVYVCGLFNYFMYGYNQLIVAKYNSSGTIQWQYLIDGAGNEGGGYGVAVDSSANVYVCGYISDSLYAAKFNTSGTLQWQKRLGGSAVTNYGVAVDSSGNVYVCGYAYPSGDGAYIAKYDTSGTLQWQRSLSTRSYGLAVAVDSSANVYVCGRLQQPPSYVQGLLIAKYNTSGTIQWQRRLDGPNSMAGASIVIDSFDNLYISGNLYDSEIGYQLFFAKLPSDGSLTGTYTVGGYSITYAASTLTESAGVLTELGVYSTRATSTITDAASNLTDAATSLTSVVTTI